MFRSAIGRDTLVQGSRSSAWLPPVLNRHRHVVRGLHLCRDGHAGEPSLPRGLGNRPDIQDL